MRGIKELAEAVKFVCALATSVSDAMEDGKISVGDATRLLPLLYSLPSAIDGLEEVVDEVSDLSEDEILQIEQIVIDELDLPSDVETGIHDAVEVALKLYALVQKLKA